MPLCLAAGEGGGGGGWLSLCDPERERERVIRLPVRLYSAPQQRARSPNFQGHQLSSFRDACVKTDFDII